MGLLRFRLGLVREMLGGEAIDDAVLVCIVYRK